MRLTFTLLFSIISAMITLQAQSINDHLIVLDNYQIPIDKEGATIGRFIGSGIFDEDFSILEDKSGLFEIENKYLKLKNSISLDEESPISFSIVVKYGEIEKAFTLVKDNFIRNKVVAHRGAWKNNEASQNSLKSLNKAIEIGCEASEFDVWMAADGIMVLSHDPEIGGKKVEEVSSLELLQIPLKDGDHVPTLEQYINRIKEQNKTRVVLEIKESEKGKERGEISAEVTVKKIHEMQAQAWVDYITFSFDIANRIRQLDPTAKILYLESNKDLAILDKAKISGIDYHYSLFINNKELVTEAKALNMLTNAWTVNKEEDMKTLLDQGLDYLTTDEPEKLLRLIEK